MSYGLEGKIKFTVWQAELWLSSFDLQQMGHLTEWILMPSGAQLNQYFNSSCPKIKFLSLFDITDKELMYKMMHMSCRVP